MPRFYNALLGALALHGLLLLAHARHAAVSAVRVAEPAAEQLIDIDDVPLSESAAIEPAGQEPASQASAESKSSSSPGATGRLARNEARLAASSQSPSVADAPSGDDPALEGIAAQGGDAAPAEPEHKIDLGLDGHFFLGPPSEMLPRIRKPDPRPKADPQKRLENAMAAADVQRGLARGNELVGSLHAAAREAGPLRGEAMFRVTVGADGGVLSAELVQGAGSDWAAALNSFRALAARKHLRVPPGARGLRVTFAVKAKVQRPSGKEVESSSVSAGEPSLNPNGLVPHGDFDLADLGGGGQRLVYARVVAEEVL